MVKKNYVYVLGALVLFNACKADKKETLPEEKVAVETQPMADVSEMEASVILVDEHHFDQVPITSHGVRIIEGGEISLEDEPQDVTVHTAEEMHSALIENEYEPQDLEVTQAVFTLDETETFVAYNKKNEEIGVLQVVTDADGEISKIAFADKNHKDTYDVQNGMTAKEAKQLRRRLKHVKRKADHYLYDDQSNIMYLLDIKDDMGNEITTVEIDKAEIRAIVWEKQSKSE